MKIGCWNVLLFLTLMCLVNMIAVNIFCGYAASNSAPREVDDTEDELPDVLLAILVMSAPSNSDRRQAIRETWLSLLPADSVQLYFVMGSANLDAELSNTINKEQKTHNDLMVLEDLTDSYFKLTEKLLAALNRTSRRHSFTYMMKCDDDTHVDSLRLLEKLHTQPRTRLYWGYFTGAAHVKTAGQWAEPNYHLCDRYLPYARGGGYVITSDIVQYILQNSKLLQIYNSEDVTIGVWLAPLDILRLHDVGFDTEATSRGCLNHHIVSHKQTIEQMRDKHRSLQKNGKLCVREIKLRSEYQYDWAKPPSKCCIPNVT